MKKLSEIELSAPVSVRPRTGPEHDMPGTIRITRQEGVKCPVCQDAGYLRADVPFGHPSFGKIFTCVCKQRELDQRRADELHRLSRLDSFQGYDFEDFEPYVPGVEEAYEIAMSYAQNLSHQWLILSGPVGVGKTHLAVAIARYAMDYHKMPAYFAVVPDLLDHLRATFDPSAHVDYDERFATIRNAPLLVLDDLGTENATPWAQEKLFQIINHRYTEQMPTIITTNHRLDKIDQRIVSRMLDTRFSTLVEIEADDYRRRGAVGYARGFGSR